MSDSPLLNKMDALLKKHRGAGGEDHQTAMPDQAAPPDPAASPQGTPPEGAMRVAETVRNKVEKLKIPHATSSVARVCTLSAGVYTCLPQQSEKIDTLLQKADACLYQSKINGRNRVTAECCDLIAMKNQLVSSRN